MANGSKEVTLVARGNLSPRTLTSLVRVIGEVGLKTEVIDDEAYTQLRQNVAGKRTEIGSIKGEITSIEDVISPYQFLVKEHFVEFRAAYLGHLKPLVAYQAFSGLVAPKWQTGPRVDPAKYGLIVRQRHEIDLPTYKSSSPLISKTDLLALQVGSFTESLDRWNEKGWEIFDSPPHFGPIKYEFISSLSDFLKTKIETNTTKQPPKTKA